MSPDIFTAIISYNMPGPLLYIPSFPINLREEANFLVSPSI